MPDDTKLCAGFAAVFVAPSSAIGAQRLDGLGADAATPLGSRPGAEQSALLPHTRLARRRSSRDGRCPFHLPRAHQKPASEERELVGLRPRHPLQAPARSAAQGERLRRRIASERGLRAAMAVGETLARRGELQRLAERALRERPAALER